jgi:predicted HTH domain antitoxin
MIFTTRTRLPLLINKMAFSRLAQASNQEGKLLLAIQAYKRGQVLSIEKASALYTVPHSTLHDRLKDCTTRENAQL